MSEVSLPLALQVYSVREDAQKDFRKTMEDVKAMGYEGVELAGLYDMSVEEVKAILDEVGLELVSAHVPVAELEKDEVLDAYAATGMTYIAIPWMKAGKTREEVEDDIALIRSIALRVKDRGMQLLYHNHDFEFEKINGQYILDTYYSEVPADLLQTELDTCWVKVGGENPAAYLMKYEGRAPIVHLKDFKGQKNDHMYALIGDDSEAKEETAEGFELRPVGYGVQDFPAILEAAEKAGAKWLVVEQDEPSMDKTPLECAKLSIDYLKGIM